MAERTPAMELGKADDDRLALAIKQYAIYLGENRTMTLYEKWIKAESILSIWTEAELMLSYCMEAPNHRIDDSIESELLGRISYAIEALNEIKNYFENEGGVESVSAHRHRNAMLKKTKNSSHWRKGYDYVSGFFVCISSESSRLILAANSQLPRVCLSRQLIEMRFLLVSNRLRLLEPVISNLRQRRGAKRKPRDTGTRDLLLTAQVAGVTLQDLAMMLTEKGLDGGLSGSSGSLRDEKARLNTMLSKLQKGR